MMHDGHRQRLKAKLCTVPKSLEDHELLELLLYYSIPRKNTNEEAHRLLERFGTVQSVLNSGIPTLMQVEGVGENSAILLKIVSELTCRYVSSEPKYDKTPLESASALNSYLTSLFLCTDVEMSYLVLFDKSKRLMGAHLLSSGDSSSTAISMQKIAELVSDRRTAYVILAHNHPNGRAIPSGEDIAVTNIISNFLRPMPVQFIDHFVVSGNDCIGIKRTSSSSCQTENTIENIEAVGKATSKKKNKR